MNGEVMLSGVKVPDTTLRSLQSFLRQTPLFVQLALMSSLEMSRINEKRFVVGLGIAYLSSEV